jgi:hypothetical protein
VPGFKPEKGFGESARVTKAISNGKGQNSKSKKEEPIKSKANQNAKGKDQNRKMPD